MTIRVAIAKFVAVASPTLASPAAAQRAITPVPALAPIVRAAAVAALLCAGLSAATAQDLTPPAGFDDMFSDLTENNLTGEELRTLDSYDRISVVRLDEAVAESEREALQDVLDESEDGFAEVQTAIRRNGLLQAAFEEEGIDLAMVLAVTGEEGGDLTVYLDEPVIR